MTIASVGTGEVLGWVLAALLVALGAALAALDRSLERLSRSRVEALAESGNKRAHRLLRVLEKPVAVHDTLQLCELLASQAAAVVVAVGLSGSLSSGWLWLVVPLVAIASFVIAGLVAGLVRGKGVEPLALSGVFVAAWLTHSVGWLARPLAAPGRRVARARSDISAADGVDVPTELRELIDRAGAGQVLEKEEARMISSVFEFGDTIVREVMTPRPDMVCLPAAACVDDALAMAVERGVSRIPVFDEGLDDVCGILYVKDLLAHLNGDPAGAAARQVETVGALVRPAHFVPEQKRTADMLAEMREKKFHMAIVVDEYGGTAGLVTMEDLLEELVGEITDEYDTDEELVEYRADGSYVVAGRLSLDDLGEVVDVAFDLDDADTVGGAMLALLGRVPEAGDSVRDPATGVVFTALRITGHRVEAVEVRGVAHGGHPAASGERAPA